MSVPGQTVMLPTFVRPARHAEFGRFSLIVAIFHTNNGDLSEIARHTVNPHFVAKFSTNFAPSPPTSPVNRLLNVFKIP